jgi:hypothetical protein
MASRFHPTLQTSVPISELKSSYGQKHRHYPKNVRQYYELNSNQLGDLLAFFHQTYPSTAETTTVRYSRPIHLWLGYNGQPHSLDVEHKRSLFGRFIGLEKDLVYYKINPLKYQEVYDKQAIAEATRPSGNPPSGGGPPGTAMTGAGTSGAGTVQGDEKRRDKWKGFSAWFCFGK